MRMRMRMKMAASKTTALVQLNRRVRDGISSSLRARAPSQSHAATNKQTNKRTKAEGKTNSRPSLYFGCSFPSHGRTSAADRDRNRNWNSDTSPNYAISLLCFTYCSPVKLNIELVFDVCLPGVWFRWPLI